MEVTVIIPDEFADQLIPPGRDASRVVLEELVDGARWDGRINVKQANEILGIVTRPAHKAQPDIESSDEEIVERFRNLKPPPEWLNDPDQVRRHVAVERGLGILKNRDLPRSNKVREAVGQSMWEQHERERQQVG